MIKYCDYCKVPIHYELHDGYHKIKEWNDGVIEDAKKKSMEKFDKELANEKKPKEKQRWKSLDM